MSLRVIQGQAIASELAPIIYLLQKLDLERLNKW